MDVYCDSSTKLACYIIEGHSPVILQHRHKVTVNEGEYLAVIAALEALGGTVPRAGANIVLFTDSQLVVNQVKGLWKCRAKNLMSLQDRARRLAHILDVSIRWVPREENLAGIVLGEKRCYTQEKTTEVS